jgi:hypothetical protein
MSARNDRPTRRNVVKAAGLGAGAGLLAPMAALAQGAPTSAQPEIWSAEYTARKGAVSLAAYRKRAGAPRPRE